LLYPYSVRVCPKGGVYVTDTYNHRIRKIEGTSFATYVSSNDGKMVRYPADVAFGTNGDVFISNSDCSQIVKKASSSGLVKPLKGFKVNGKVGDNLTYPSQIDFLDDHLYIADTMRDRVVVLNLNTLEAQSHPVKRPVGLTVNRKTKEITFTQRGINRVSVWRDNDIYPLAGSLLFGFLDGQGLQATFFEPIGLSSREDGSVVVADAGNHSIRIIDPQGYVVTLAGDGSKGQRDGRDARFNYPMGVEATEDGCVLVADTYNHSVRKILPNLEIETVGK